MSKRCPSQHPFVVAGLVASAVLAGCGGTAGHDAGTPLDADASTPPPTGDTASHDAGMAPEAGTPRDAGASSPAASCSNPVCVLPLNPTNPQDGITLSGFYVDTDTWNAAGYSVSQTMVVCDYDNWYVVANMDDKAGDGAVKTYPNVHKDFDSAPAIASFATLASSFAHAGPHVGIYEFAYDIWLNGVASNGSTEVMIWTDNFHQTPSGSVLETVTLDGDSYQLYRSGSYIAFVRASNVTSGRVNLLSFFNHLVAKGWIPATSTLGAVDYGVELVSTDGTDATFQVSDFSLTTN